MHTLAQLCVRRPVFATMLILSLVVVGIFSYFPLGVDLFPKVDIPTVIVIIANPGASPEEIETEISKKVEDTVNTISQVDEVRSTSSCRTCRKPPNSADFVAGRGRHLFLLLARRRSPCQGRYPHRHRPWERD